MSLTNLIGMKDEANSRLNASERPKGVFYRISSNF